MAEAADTGRGDAPEPSSTGLDPTLAGLLCYLLGFVTGLVFLVLERESSFVRFHAMQSTLVFIGLFVAQTVAGFIPLLGGLLVGLLGLVGLGVWIVCMVKAFQGERFELPLVGEIAAERARIAR